MKKSIVPSVVLILSLVVSQLSAAPPSSSAPDTGPLKRIEESKFGTMADGTIVKLYTLKNANRITAKVMTYGAIIAGVQTPDKDGKLADVMAAPADWAATPRFNMLAQTIGPIANRIGGTNFTLDGKTFTMEGNNTLHSGSANTGTKNWTGKALEPKDHEAAAELTYTHKDGTAGFPGNITFKVTFSLNDDNEFSLHYEATTDKTTIVNLTNHCYWNLAGFTNGTAPPANNLELWVDADKYLAANAALIPTGEFLPVKDTPFDFTKPALIGSRAPQRGYDNAFVLNSGGKMAPAARLHDPASGRTMELRTDQPGIQVYTGQRTGVALETQHHPDSIHHDNFPTTVLKPGETFKATTTYVFSAK